MTIRPALRPGAAVLRRDDRHLQIGTSPGIVLDDRPGLMSLLLSFDGTHDLPLDPLLQELLALGAVVDASSWSTRTPAEARALSVHADPAQLEARSRAAICVVDDGGSHDFAELVRELLHDAGVERTDHDDPALLVLVSSGEPARHVFDEAVRRCLTHLPVRLDEDRVLIGPFVVPGSGPCVRCHDLHRGDWDRSWWAVVPQLGARSPHHNPPAPRVLTAHAAAVEVADAVLDHLAGRPALRGMLHSIGPHHRDRDVWRIAFHPRCPCALLLPVETAEPTTVGRRLS